GQGKERQVTTDTSPWMIYLPADAVGPCRGTALDRGLMPDSLAALRRTPFLLRRGNSIGKPILLRGWMTNGRGEPRLQASQLGFFTVGLDSCEIYTFLPTA